jgi:iron transport multicopper oxidase
MILPAALVALSAVASAYASIGPSASISIVNKVISPDGFPRSAVLAGGTFPGPVIRGKKVGIDCLVRDTWTYAS